VRRDGVEPLGEPVKLAVYLYQERLQCFGYCLRHCLVVLGEGRVLGHGFVSSSQEERCAAGRWVRGST
jgi:hypothetical protein